MSGGGSGVSYAGDVLLVRVVKVVDLLLEGVQDLAVSRHVGGEDQRDGSLTGERRGSTTLASGVLFADVSLFCGVRGINMSFASAVWTRSLVFRGSKLIGRLTD